MKSERSTPLKSASVPCTWFSRRSPNTARRDRSVSELLCAGPEWPHHRGGVAGD